MVINGNKPATLPPVGAHITVRIPDGRAPLPMTVEAVEEVDDGEGGGGIFAITGRTLAAGRYGYGSEARPYGAGEKVTEYVTHGDEWLRLKAVGGGK